MAGALRPSTPVRGFLGPLRSTIASRGRRGYDSLRSSWCLTGSSVSPRAMVAWATGITTCGTCASLNCVGVCSPRSLWAGRADRSSASVRSSAWRPITRVKASALLGAGAAVAHHHPAQPQNMAAPPHGGMLAISVYSSALAFAFRSGSVPRCLWWIPISTWRSSPPSRCAGSMLGCGWVWHGPDPGRALGQGSKRASGRSSGVELRGRGERTHVRAGTPRSRCPRVSVPRKPVVLPTRWANTPDTRPWRDCPPGARARPPVPLAHCQALRQIPSPQGLHGGRGSGDGCGCAR